MNSEYSRQLISMAEADNSLRDELLSRGELHDGYNPEMERLHNRNADQLATIMEAIGYPSEYKVGKEACDACWLIIQHAIGKPVFMKHCHELLEASVNIGEGDQVQLAYLTDRIASFEGRSQVYGTNFDWDLNGELNPTPYDDLTLVNKRRSKLGMLHLSEQTYIMRQRALDEGETAPADPEARLRQFDAWRKKTGWLQ